MASLISTSPFLELNVKIGLNDSNQKFFIILSNINKDNTDEGKKKNKEQSTTYILHHSSSYLIIKASREGN
jgi:hypothetical protein